MRLRAIRWQDYQTPAATGKQVSRMLEALASRKEERAMKAGHALWQALCAGQVHPAAVPCCPFLIEIMTITSTPVQAEILDLLLKFSNVGTHAASNDWEQRLRKTMQDHRDQLSKFSYSGEPTISDKASRIIQQLEHEPQ